MSRVPERIAALIAKDVERTACLRELAAQVSRDLGCMVPGSPCAISVEVALRIWRPRQGSTARAGIETSGFEQTLANLSGRNPAEQILVYALKSASSAFVLFVDSGESEVIGCIGVARESEQSRNQVE